MDLRGPALHAHGVQGSDALNVTDLDLRKLLTFDPENGRLLLGNERYLLFRQEAFAQLRKLLLAQLGPALFRSILSQFGFRCGHGDYEALSKGFAWDSEMDRMGAGPVMHTWEGIVRADPTFLEFDRERRHFHMKGTWKNSYEAEIHLREFGPSPTAVCHTLTGYASGWCSAFIGFDVIAIEPTCIAKGDSICTFHIQPPSAWGPQAAPWKEALSSTDYSLSKELEHKIATIEEQSRAIRQLATPVIEVWDDILALPIIGRMDSARGAELLESTLSAITHRNARCVILDVTGVDTVDTFTAGQIINVARAAQLLGTYCVVTGVRSQIAHTLVSLGVELAGLRTLRTLKDGLRDCLRHLQKSH